MPFKASMGHKELISLKIVKSSFMIFNPANGLTHYHMETTLDFEIMWKCFKQYTDNIMAMHQVLREQVVIKYL